MPTNYRITMKSQEERGATQPNIIELGFASDADALAFGDNLNLCIAGQVVSIDKLLSSDYSLPYPAGSDAMTRSALNDGAGHWLNIRVFDTPPAFAPVTRAAALIAAGFKIVTPDLQNEYTPTSCNVQVFTPGASV